ncbi:MAG TPA: alpha-ketoglutarate-dependent dioxygenase AlkB [Terriglobales bacterium]|nr:alpha-ketoglutarate-dependent dioxygenase AlkB [Terriglobales bacterium]
MPSDTADKVEENAIPSSSQSIDLPEGFVYRPGLLTEAEQAVLVDAISDLQFRPVDFQGHRAKRRVVEFGFQYDFTSRKTTTTESIPDFLVPTRHKAAAFAEVPSEKLVEAIVTEYPLGAPIGWHRDAPQFELIVGVSLGSSCRMRLKPLKGGKISSVVLAPGSAYFMRGSARWNYQHSIPAVKDLRYSITFRTLRERK